MNDKAKAERDEKADKLVEELRRESGVSGRFNLYNMEWSFCNGFDAGYAYQAATIEKLKSELRDIAKAAKWYHEVWAGWNEPSVEHEIRHWLAVELQGQIEELERE
ncbi:MAG TPA: hypothetical protein VGD26_12640 [Chitinophagaceae bacterium]